MPKMEEDLVHGCGRTFKYPAHYAKHGLQCDGTKPETSGRIAAIAKAPDRTPPARKRTAVQRKKRVAKTIRMRVPRAVVTGVRAKFLDELRADRAKLTAMVEKIDDTIRSIEALA